MSTRAVGISVDDNTSDTCGRGGGGWSVDEDAHDMCRGEGEGGRGGSVDGESLNDMCKEEVGGGGMSMDDVSTDTSGLGR